MDRNIKPACTRVGRHVPARFIMQVGTNKCIYIGLTWENCHRVKRVLLLLYCVYMTARPTDLLSLSLSLSLYMYIHPPTCVWILARGINNSGVYSVRLPLSGARNGLGEGAWACPDENKGFSRVQAPGFRR